MTLQPQFSNTDVQLVDYTAVKVQQFFMISGLLLALATGFIWLTACVACITIFGAIIPSAGLPQAIYLYLLKPTGILKPDIQADHPDVHRFAQGLGGCLTATGMCLLGFGYTFVGWVLIGIIITLATMNLFSGRCAGVLTYYQFNRMGIPGFIHSPIKK